jgi:single-strand DNA-binding protein
LEIRLVKKWRGKMPNMNKVFILGHLVRDAEMRYANNGSGVANVTVAVNRSYGDETDFIDVTIWDRGNYKQAEYNKDAKKGDLVLVKGELRQDRWENNNGEKRSKLKINADKVVNFTQKPDNNSQQNSNEVIDNFDDFNDSF